MTTDEKEHTVWIFTDECDEYGDNYLAVDVMANTEKAAAAAALADYPGYSLMEMHKGCDHLAEVLFDGEMISIGLCWEGPSKSGAIRRWFEFSDQSGAPVDMDSDSYFRICEIHTNMVRVIDHAVSEALNPSAHSDERDSISGKTRRQLYADAGIDRSPDNVSKISAILRARLGTQGLGDA